LRHEPHVHEWEIEAGANIMQWMETHHGAADHVLYVVSPKYLRAPYSTLCVLRDQGDHASARPLIERALDISERIPGSGHPQTQLYRRNLASRRPQSFLCRFISKLR
jgi:hypothetical protein